MSNKCSICLKNEPRVVNIWQKDANNVKWSSKLVTCVPEVDWIDEYCICQTCIEQLEIVCSFRERCLHSDSLRKVNKSIKDEVESNFTEQEFVEAQYSPDTKVDVNNDSENSDSNECICHKCNKKCTSKVALSQHIRHHKKKQFKCIKCGKMYMTKKVMQTHVKVCDGIKRRAKDGSKSKVIQQKKGTLSCKMCSARFKNSSLLLQHVKSVHAIKTDEEKAVCTSFNRTFLTLEEQSTASDDKTKQVTASDDKTKQLTAAESEYSCEFCSELFISGKKFIEHIVNIHKEDPKVLKPFKCKKCDNRYVHLGTMQAHLKQHENSHRHICSFCGKAFKAKNDLQVHECIHLNKRNYRCELCNKGFNTYKNLGTHNVVKHKDPSTWKYHCSVCDRKFPLKTNYDYHMRRHMGDKRFSCRMCEKTFITKDEVMQHMSCHTNVKDYKCEHCEQEYKTKRSLLIHLKRVHGLGNAQLPVRVRNHVCSMCPKAFYDKNKLVRHMCTHTGEKPFSCHLCEKRFTDRSYVNQHLKLVHNVVNNSDNI